MHAEGGAAVPGTDYRAQGNEAFVAGEFEHAMERYSSSLEQDPSVAEVWSNRAACYLKLARPYLAAADAYQLLDLRPEWPKTYYRLGRACAEMGGISDAREWYELGLTCASMQQLRDQQKTFEKCLRKLAKAVKEGKDVHAQLAKEMEFDSDSFYVPMQRFGRNICVSHDPRQYQALVTPFPIQIRDIGASSDGDDGGKAGEAEADRDGEGAQPDSVVGGGRGLFATKQMDTYSTVFVDEQILCISYSPFLCDFCGAALPSHRDAVPAKPKEAEQSGVTNAPRSCETYCSTACSTAAAECYFGPSLSAESAQEIAKLRRDLFAAAQAEEAPIASSYHVLGAIRLAAMVLARRWYRSHGQAVPERLERRLAAFDLLVRPGDLGPDALLAHGFKVPYHERYRQFTQIKEILKLPNNDPELSFEWYDDAWGAMLFNALRSSPDSCVEDDPAVGRISTDYSDVRMQSVSIMAIGSFINHSSTPNVTLRRVKVGAAFPTHTFQFVSLRPIDKGEELLLSYVDPALPDDVKRSVLRSQYMIYEDDPDSSDVVTDQ